MAFKLRSFFLRALVMGLATLVGLICLDVVVRIAGFDKPIIWRPHPVLGWWHVPGARAHWTDEGDGQVQINSLGLRDPERAAEKPAGVFRIAVFGDSMTEGVQVNLDRTFTQQLEARFRSRGIRVEVLNFGVNGYSPLQELLLFKQVAETFKPDLVVQAVFLDNDVADLQPELSTSQGGGPELVPPVGDELRIDFTPAERSYRDYNSQPVATIRSLSALYRFATEIKWQRRARASAQAAASANRGIPRRYLLYAQPAQPLWDDAWTRLERVIDAFSREASTRGSRFMVLSVPCGQVVNQSAWQALVKETPSMAAQQWDLDAPERRLHDLSQRLNVPLLSTVEAFRKRPDPGSLFFGRIGHFTPAGHETMAELLDAWLVGGGYVGSSARRTP